MSIVTEKKRMAVSWCPQNLTLSTFCTYCATCVFKHIFSLYAVFSKPLEVTMAVNYYLFSSLFYKYLAPNNLTILFVRYYLAGPTEHLWT